MEVFFEDDDINAVDIDDVKGFLLGITEGATFDDDMPWSAVSAPYDVEKEQHIYAELHEIHRNSLVVVSPSTKYICDFESCVKPCCQKFRRFGGKDG